MVLKLALLNTIKPQEGSGEGITEYFYNIYNQFSEFGLNPELVYSRTTRDLNHDYGSFLNRIINRFIFVYDYKNISSELKGMKSRYDIVHVASQELGFAAKQIKRRGISKQVITTIHDLILLGNENYLSNYNKFLRATYYNIVKASIYDAVNYSDFIIFDSQLTRRKFVSKYGNKYNTAVVNLGIPNAFTREIPKIQKHEDFIVGYLGALEPKKNLALILNSAKELLGYDDIKFYIYGMGSLYKKYLDYSVKNKLSNVEFMGFAEKNKILEVYDSFDVFIDPVVSAGFELPILEAQARGLPVIIDNNSEIPEEVNKYCLKAVNEKHIVQIIKDLKENIYIIFEIVFRENDKTDIVNYFDENEIETRNLLPIVNQSVYKSYFKNKEQDFPVATELNRIKFYIGKHSIFQMTT